MSDGEIGYTVASDSEAVSEDVEGGTPFVETAIGIDLGTCECRVAVWRDSKVELLQNPGGQRTMPSYVLFQGDTPATGVSSTVPYREPLELLSGSAIFNVKRLIGRMDTDPVVQNSKNLPFMIETLEIGVRPFIAALSSGVWRSTTPEEVLAILLVELRAMAEVQLGRAVRSVVLTMPVSFSRFQQTRIERACAMAGLHVLRMMPEPTAPLLLYAQQQQMASQGIVGSASEKLVVIFNMGAGYCDVAVAATAGGVSQIKALAGAAIGGEDILQNVMMYVTPEICPLSRSPRGEEAKAVGMLRIAAQNAIHTLSSHDSATIEIDISGMKISKTLLRNDFERINCEVFQKCEDIIAQCLFDSQIDVENIADVILVGGGSHIPMIRSIVLRLCQGKSVYEGLKPLEATVCGAALEGAIASGVSDPNLELLTIQATPLSLGVRADGTEVIPIVHRNATIPARKDAFFTTSYDNQSEALIVVYEGEGRKVGDNHLMGFFKLSGIPPAPRGVPLINVCMDVDAANVLRVFAGVTMPESQTPVIPYVEVRMPNVDDGHGWCIEALLKKYGTSLDICTAQKHPQKQE